MKTINVKACPKCRSLRVSYGKKNRKCGAGIETWTPDKSVYECQDCGQRTGASSMAAEVHEVSDNTTLCPSCNGYKWEFSNSRIGDVTLMHCVHCNTTMMPNERKTIE